MTELITIYNNDRPLMRARALAGFDVLKAQPMVDPEIDLFGLEGRSLRHDRETPARTARGAIC
jgi:hypothetical protein